MLDHVVTDIELKNAVLRELRQPRPAFFAAASPDREEHHLWHVATSAATISGGTLNGVDVYVISGFWAPIMPLLPGGAVSTAIGSALQPDSIRLAAQNFKSTEGVTHRQHRERNVQLPLRRQMPQKGK